MMDGLNVKQFCAGSCVSVHICLKKCPDPHLRLALVGNQRIEVMLPNFTLNIYFNPDYRGFKV